MLVRPAVGSGREPASCRSCRSLRARCRCADARLSAPCGRKTASMTICAGLILGVKPRGISPPGVLCSTEATVRAACAAELSWVRFCAHVGGAGVAPWLVGAPAKNRLKCDESPALPIVAVGDPLTRGAFGWGIL